VLLSADKDDLAVVVQLFDQEQIQMVIKQSADLIGCLNSQAIDTIKASENAIFIQGYLEYLRLEQ
jgi:hypothetical protein